MKRAHTEVKSRLLLDVVVGESPTILELLARKDQALLIGRNTLLVLNLCLDIVDGVRGLDLEGYRLPREGLDKDLHASTETKDEVECGLLLNVIIGQSTPILELLPSKDQTLLVGRDALLVLNLCLDIIDGVRGLDLECDGLAREGLDEDLHASTETKDEVEGGLLLNVVVRQGAPVLELLAGKNEALLVRRNAAARRSVALSRFDVMGRYAPFLVLDLGLDVVDGVGGLHLEGDGLSSEGFDENLHSIKRVSE